MESVQKVSEGGNLNGNRILRRILYAACFMVFAAANHRVRVGAWDDIYVPILRNLMGVSVAAMIMSSYKSEDYHNRKKPYIIDLTVCVFAAVFCFIYQNYINPCVITVWESLICCVLIIMYGHIFMHTFFALFIDHKRVKIRKGMYVLLIIMLAWMSISDSDLYWPLGYMAMFGLLFITDFSEEDIKFLWLGATDGIIVFFLILQGFALLFRPYEAVRYIGSFTNCNNANLFYLEVLSAVFGRLIQAQRSKKKTETAIFYVLAAASLAFIVMTVGRLAYAVAAVICLIYLLIVASGSDRKVKAFFAHGFILLGTFLIAFPVCFFLSAKVPCIVNFAYKFPGEVYTHEVDTDKIVTFEKLTDSILGRFNKMAANISSADAESREDAEQTVSSYSSVTSESVENGSETGTETETSGGQTPMLAKKSDMVRDVRYYIYSYFIKQVNLMGHPESEIRFLLFPGYSVGHAHNLYLQYALEFGWPVLVFFIPLLIWSEIRLFIKTFRERSILAATALFFLTVEMLFGIFEFCWETCSLSMIMMFFAFGVAMAEKDNKSVPATEK